MDSGMIMLILNVALLVVLLLGFLFGLKGVKKSGLSLAFFVGAVIVTILITPLVSKLLFKIPFIAGLLDNVMSQINESALVSELAGAGTSIEALLTGLPQMVLNLVVFMLLVIIVGLLFKIPYAITLHAINKKHKNKNPIGKKSPANVSATGDVSYVREEPKEKKHRLLGGLLGAIHALVFLVAFLTPVMGIVSTVADVAFQTEPATTTAMITLDVSAEPQGEKDEPQYTELAKLIQENIPSEVLDIIKTVDNSILGTVVSTVDVGDVIFNSIAKCEVNGQTIKLKQEINTAVDVYNDVMFITNVDFSTPEGISELDFDKVRHALNSLFNSKLLSTVFPEVGGKYLDWVTMKQNDYNLLSSDIKQIVDPVRDALNKQPNLKELVEELHAMMDSENKQIEFIKKELNIVVDIAEIVVDSGVLDKVMVDTEPEITEIIDILHANNNKVIHDVINKIFESDIVNLSTLTGTNYGIDALNDMFEDKFGNNAVYIAKIVLADAENRFDGTMFCNIADIVMDIYSEYADKIDEIGDDLSLLITDNLSTVLGNVGKVFDSIKNMAILNEFRNNSYISTMNAIIENVAKFEFDMGGKTIKITDYIDVLVLKNSSYSLETELKNLSPLFETLLAKEGDSVYVMNLLDSVSGGDMSELVSNFGDEQIENILTPLSNSKLFKPAYIYLVNEINKAVVSSLGSDVQGFEGIDINTANISEEQAQQVVTIVKDAKELLTGFEAIQDGTKTFQDIITENSEVVVDLLETLQDNANDKDGIFKEVYSELCDFIENSDLEGIADILGDTPNYANIDWQSIIDNYLN